MTCIEIDLEDYKDEVKYTFCNNNNCLRNDCGVSFKRRFKEYISELDKELFIYTGTSIRTPQVILKELKTLYSNLI